MNCLRVFSAKLGLPEWEDEKCSLDSALSMVRYIVGYAEMGSDALFYYDMNKDGVEHRLQEVLRLKILVSGSGLSLSDLGRVAEFEDVDRVCYGSAFSLSYSLYDTPYLYDRVGKFDVLYVPVLCMGFILEDVDGRFFNRDVKFSPLYNVVCLRDKHGNSIYIKLEPTGNVQLPIMGFNCKVFQTDNYMYFFTRWKKEKLYG